MDNHRASTLRPIGNRILVRRLPTPERSASGLYLLGRDEPTLGNWNGVIVQWSEPNTNYDLRRISDDYLVLPRDWLNFVITAGVAHPVNDRLFVEPLAGTFEHTTNIIVMHPSRVTRYARARVRAVGPKVNSDIYPGAVVLFSLTHISEVRFDQQTYFTLRSEQCIATIEED